MNSVSFHPTDDIEIIFLELAITSSQHCPNHLALFFDELSSVFLHRNSERKDQQVNKPFLIWLTNLVSTYFECNFVVDELPASSSVIELQILYALNTADEIQRSETESSALIALNVAETVLNPSAK